MFNPGKIIEYLENGKFICGFITETHPKRVHLFNQNRREINLPVSRIVHCSHISYPIDGNRDNLVHILQETNENRAKLMDEIDLEEIWDLLCEEGVDSFDPAFLAELVFGQEATDDFISAFLRAVFINKTYFKYKEGKIRVHSREQVETLLKQAEKEHEKKTADT
jgi:exoribonuclease-2